MFLQRIDYVIRIDDSRYELNLIPINLMGQLSLIKTEHIDDTMTITQYVWKWFWLGHKNRKIGLESVRYQNRDRLEIINFLSIPSKMTSLKLLIFLSFCNCLVLTFPLRNKYSHDKRLTRTLRVSALQNEPFINPNSYGDLKKGIEFELIKTIAENENLKLLRQNRSQ